MHQSFYSLQSQSAATSLADGTSQLPAVKFPRKVKSIAWHDISSDAVDGVARQPVKRVNPLF
jgi:hypothetical protein